MEVNKQKRKLNSLEKIAKGASVCISSAATTMFILPSRKRVAPYFQKKISNLNLTNYEREVAKLTIGGTMITTYMSTALLWGDQIKENFFYGLGTLVTTNALSYLYEKYQKNKGEHKNKEI